MTRRSTLRICCTIGATRMRPGPLMPVKRPSVNMTPRSYSFSTLTVVKNSAATKTTTTMMNGMILFPSNGLDPEPQTFDFYDANLLADVYRSAGGCVPQLSGVAHLPLFSEVLDDFGSLTHHDPLARDDRPALRAAPQECDGEHHEPTDRCNSNDQRHTDSHAGSLRVEQDDGADDECHEAAEPERAKRRHMKFGDDHPHSQDHERGARVVHRQDLQREEREHE